MKHYQEITIIENPEVSKYCIWSKLFTQVHLALVEAKNPDDTVNIGISFPEYACFEAQGKTIAILGSKLRVFAKSKAELEKLNLNKWCARLRDYVHLKSIAEVGDKATKHVVVQRFRQVKNKVAQNKNYASKNGRNYSEVRENSIAYIAKTNSISIGEAEEFYDNPILAKRPYILMQSLSSNKKYSLEIDQQPADKPQAGTFSTYGLSTTTTVPHW